MTRIRVVQPGFQTTVQDLGRFGFAHIGVSPCGAADTLSLRAGNRLVGNADGAAAIEMTLAGATFVFEGDAVFALTGANFEASLEGDPLPFWRAVKAAEGTRLQIGPARDGARCYLCLAGGVEVPEVLGSRSTDLRAGFGGLRGRALRREDTLEIARAEAHATGDLAKDLSEYLRGPVIRVTGGPLSEGEYTVSEDSNRLGIRLSGPPLEGREILTEGVSLGAIQVPADGQPIILFVDQQTTGGYTKLANVITADLPKVGQLRPRDRVRFEVVDFAAAIDALRRQESLLP